MKFVGLTGGIGAGKSTVAARLAGRGAHVLDVDVLSRELQEPGQPYFEQIVARWGPSVVGGDGRLDRARLAEVVFNDKEQLAELTHMAAPFAEGEIIRRAQLHADTDDVMVIESAMFLRPMYGMTGVIVVDVPPEVALGRLVGERGMSEEDARARIASQLPRATRLEHADHVVDNSGDLDALDAALDATWRWIRALPDATPTLDRGAV